MSITLLFKIHMVTVSKTLNVFDYENRTLEKHSFSQLYHPFFSLKTKINPDIFESITHLHLFLKCKDEETYFDACKILEYITPTTTVLSFSCEFIKGYPVRIPRHIRYLGLDFAYHETNTDFREFIDNLPVSLEALSIMYPIAIENPPPVLKFINFTHANFVDTEEKRIAGEYFETIPTLELVRFGYNFYSSHYAQKYSIYTREILE